MTKIYQCIIVGSGFGGLCMGIKLKQAGINDFLILEKADSLGGTWRENTYPGAECDVGSAYYSYSFAPNPDWDYKWSKQPQILAYLNKCANDFSLNKHFQFDSEVVDAKFDETNLIWILTTNNGAIFQTRFFVPAIGQLHNPNIPNIVGHADFQGESFHSAQWRHDIDLNNKSVGVIGNAASAVQLIPEIAKQVKQLTVYQRSANWMVPKGDRAYNRLEKWIAKHTTALSKFYRLQMWTLGEAGLLPMIKGKKLHRWLGEMYSQRAMKKHIKDPILQKALTPDYPIGAKRILLTDEYYPALNRENVELVTEAIENFTNTGLVGSGGQEREHDAIIFATGFKTNPFLASINITGIAGENIRSHWKDGAFAYQGVITSGFPNMFMLYGPNTNTGHTSVIFFHEVQCDYIIQLMQKTVQGAIDVIDGVEKRFDEEMQQRLQKMAWNKIAESWYKEGNRIPNNWPGSTLEYKRRLKHPDWSHFSFT